jgi:hypothetical protein
MERHTRRGRHDGCGRGACSRGAHHAATGSVSSSSSSSTALPTGRSWPSPPTSVTCSERTRGREGGGTREGDDRALARGTHTATHDALRRAPATRSPPHRAPARVLHHVVHPRTFSTTSCTRTRSPPRRAPARVLPPPFPLPATGGEERRERQEEERPATG